MLARRRDAAQPQIHGCLTPMMRMMLGKRILRRSNVQKLFGKAPRFRSWPKAELVGTCSLQIFLGAGLGAFPFGDERRNSIHDDEGD